MDEIYELDSTALRLIPPEERAHSCCFTGHREMSGETRRLLVPKLSELTLRLYTEGYRRFYVGGAYGFDLLAAAAVVAIIRSGCSDAELVFAYPFPGHDSRWSSADRELLARLRSYAAEEIYVSQSYHPGAYAMRNRYMVERSSACVAYYLAGREQSGTGQTVRMAERAGHTIYRLP